MFSKTIITIRNPGFVLDP